MTWKKHPGIWFSLYAMETIFLLSVIFPLNDWVSPLVERCVLFVWSAFMFYGVVYYHAKWAEKLAS